jgi:hypothetical protein
VNRSDELLLVEALRRLGGRATGSDVVRATGWALADTEARLRKALSLYRSHLSVDESGELLYRFYPGFVRREPAERGGALRSSLWRGAVKLFRFAVFATLVGYTVLFCVVAIVAMVALLAAADGDFFEFDGIGELFVEMFAWGAAEAVYLPVDLAFVAMMDTDARGNRLATGLREPYALEARYITDRYRFAGKNNRIYDAIYGFVFGPQRPEPPSEPSDRELLAWIEDHRFAITITELISRTGASLAAADEEMTRLMVRYDGEPHVTPDGELLYTFPRLRVTAGGAAADATSDVRPAPPAWHRFEADKELTGNSGCLNGMVGAMATFVLVSSAIMTVLATASVVFSWAALITVVPLFVSVLYLTIPMVRVPAWRRENQARRQRNLRRASLLTIFEHLSGDYALTEGQMVSRTRYHLGALQAASADEDRPEDEDLEDADAAAVRVVLQKVLVEMEAEPEADDQGQVRYRFPRQRAELAAADAWREGRAQLDEVGRIVYATDRDEDDDVLAEEIDALAADPIAEEAEVDHAIAEEEPAAQS